MAQKVPLTVHAMDDARSFVHMQAKKGSKKGGGKEGSASTKATFNNPMDEPGGFSGQKTPLFFRDALIYKMHYFTKTGSGQT
jgi:hypothetical protein